MSTTVEVVDHDNDAVELCAHVTTESATGEQRVYEVSIRTEDTIGWEHILHGRRIDDDAPDVPAGGGVTDHAYQAAADRFKDEGYEVFGR